MDAYGGHAYARRRQSAAGRGMGDPARRSGGGVELVAPKTREWLADRVANPDGGEEGGVRKTERQSMWICVYMEQSMY
jgi:hypothetical protein